MKTDETTSPKRQREAGDIAAERLGAEVVGYAEDLDVSASKTTPFERPELGEWPARPDDHDVITWWRLDRAVRFMADMAVLARQAKQHGKRLIFAEGPGGASLEPDMTSITSKLIIMLLAFAAQMESQAIKEPVTGANAALRARWPLRGRAAAVRIPTGPARERRRMDACPPTRNAWMS
ncbi:recombinase family protein [Streptomyces sp. NPDC050509]|uniref:recombinase family protein n=1 Tax=Streptomyces sp. NPDC050509 TaxID=3365620 RepID=UPI0037A988BD